LALRTMPVSAGVVGDERVRAVLAAQDMAAEGCGAAALDRTHHLELLEAHMAGISSTPCRTMAAENIRDLQCRARHARRASGGRLVLGDLADQAIERAHHVADDFGRNLGVARGGVQFDVTEQRLNHANVDALLQ